MNFLKKLIVLSSITVVMAFANDDVPLKVGFIYVGPVGDFGWSYQHDQARKFIDEEFGDKVVTSYVESVKEGADVERVLNQLINNGHKLIFSTSFGFMNATLKAAKKNKGVFFEHATGYKQAKNLSTYAGRFYEGRYITGMLAAHVTKSNSIGYVAAYPVPEVIRGINAMALGAQSVNPDIKIKVVWTNSWYDPAKETEAAKSLINQGVDVLTQHLDSPAVVQATEESGLWSIGVTTDMSKFAPKKHLTSMVYNWNKYYEERTKAVMNNTWKSHSFWRGMDKGVFELTPFHKSIDESFKNAVMEKIDEIKSKNFHPFTGPINKKDGTLLTPEGEIISDMDLLKMNYFVSGVEGELPKN